MVQDFNNPVYIRSVVLETIKQGHVPGAQPGVARGNYTAFV